VPALGWQALPAGRQAGLLCPEPRQSEVWAARAVASDAMAAVAVAERGLVLSQEAPVATEFPAPVKAAESECLIVWPVRHAAVASGVCPETDTPLSLCPGQGPGS
jgi:hypothetical protein